MNWKERADELSRGVHIELRHWIAASGIPHDVVIDLHDNTPHPKYRELTDRFARREGVGFVTKDGYLARRQVSFFDADYSTKEGCKKLDEAVSSFRPQPYVPTKIEKMPSGLPSIPLADFEIGVEFHPVTIVGFKDRIKRVPVQAGSNVVIQLLEHLRRSILE